LFHQEGTGFFNSWNEYLELRKLAHGRFSLALRRHGIDFRGSRTVFLSAPFKRPERLLHMLIDPPGKLDEWGEIPTFSTSQLLLMLAEVVELDVVFGVAALRAYAKRLGDRQVHNVPTGETGTS